jgi:sarcosine oxidase subunit gamma
MERLGAIREMAICDLSPLPRLGFKGKGALEWLREQGVAVGDEDNRAYTQPDGSLAARLAPTEALILGGLSSEKALSARLERDWSIDTAPDCYAVPRGTANFWFLITGQRAPEMFAKLCGVDLRPHKFPVNAIAQTSVARSVGIIIRADHRIHLRAVFCAGLPRQHIRLLLHRRETVHPANLPPGLSLPAKRLAKRLF